MKNRSHGFVRNEGKPWCFFVLGLLDFDAKIENLRALGLELISNVRSPCYCVHVCSTWQCHIRIRDFESIINLEPSDTYPLLTLWRMRTAPRCTNNSETRACSIWWAKCQSNVCGLCAFCDYTWKSSRRRSIKAWVTVVCSMFLILSTSFVLGFQKVSLVRG